jgi:hypothetical protein
MKLSFRLGRKQTFLQRFRRELIFWGIPMVYLELIGIPMFGWVTVLAMVVPATLVGGPCRCDNGASLIFCFSKRKSSRIVG